MSLELPPLRNRADDIPLLVDKFLGPDWQIEPRAMEMLEKYDWPGNVRQLINAIDRAKIMADNHLIRIGDLPKELLHARGGFDQDFAPAGDDLASIQRAHVLEMLQREQGNKARTARALGINRRSLYRLLDKYGLRAD